MKRCLVMMSCALAACAVDPASAPANQAPTAQHCVSHTDGSGASCYATFTEAIAAATGGQITDAPASAADAMTDPGFAERLNALIQQPHVGAPRLSMVVGIMYVDANYRGNAWVFSEARDCDGNFATADFAVSNLDTGAYADHGFDDSISSFRSFGSCRIVLYEDWMFLGAATNAGVPSYGMAYVGDAMNDRASSIQWF